MGRDDQTSREGRIAALAQAEHVLRSAQHHWPADTVAEIAAEMRAERDREIDETLAEEIFHELDNIARKTPLQSHEWEAWVAPFLSIDARDAYAEWIQESWEFAGG